ncbi:MAG: hypothetical protein JW947_07960 [Sedimentisphaerales bacterium]|nr:hypothetical protein [Sedimentisphaerales bacterium]
MEYLKKGIGFVAGFVIVYAAIYLISGRGDLLKGFKPYHAEDGRFTASFPGEPTKKTQLLYTPTEQLDFVTYEAGSARSGFVVGYCDYSQEVTDKYEPQQMLDVSVIGAVKNVQGELMEERELDFHGHPGKEIKIKAPDDLIIRARLILVKNRLYQVMAASSSAKVVEKKGTEFFESFRVDGL